jgi:hypothetical protein
MNTSDTDSPLVAFIKAQVPIAERLADTDGVRVDHATLCALLAAHEAWAGTHRPCPTGTAEPLEADVTAVAALFKRSRSWVYLQLRYGRFPGAYVDRRGAHRFPQSCLDAFIAAERTALPATPPAVAVSGSRPASPPQPTTSAQAAKVPQATGDAPATASAAPAPAETAIVSRPSPTVAAERTSVPTATRRTPPVAAKAPTTPTPAAAPRPAQQRTTARSATEVPSTPATLTWDAWRTGRTAAGATA